MPDFDGSARQEYIEVHQLASVFLDIALHRRGPDALPASRFLLSLIIGAYALVGAVTFAIERPLSQVLGATVVHVGLYLGFFAAVLTLERRRERFLQTAIAALGVETLLGCLALPLLLTRTSESAGTAINTLVTLALLAIIVWSIDIAGFVLSRALDRAYVVGVFLVLGYVIGSIALGEFLFPAPI